MYRPGVFLIVTIPIVLSSCKNDDLLAKKSYCGFQHTDDYVRDSEKISLDEFPWMAQILYNEDKIVYCVGSLINNRYVLTNANCLSGAPRFNVTGVRFGDYDVTSDVDCTNQTIFGVERECSDPIQEFGIEEVIPHPEYKQRQNDIGLIRFSKNVVYSEYIRPICLPLSNALQSKDEEQVAMSGWGQVRFNGKFSQIKKKMAAKLISLEKCNDMYNRYKQHITSDQLCVMEDLESFTCLRDGGGPVMLSIKNQWYQIGIVLFGSTRCGDGIPTVGTKITSYLKWITENLRP